MDKYKFVVRDRHSFRSPDSENIKNRIKNNENRLKNSLDIRSKMIDVNKNNELENKSQYEIFALLSVAGRSS